MVEISCFNHKMHNKLPYLLNYKWYRLAFTIWLGVQTLWCTCLGKMFITGNVMIYRIDKVRVNEDERWSYMHNSRLMTSTYSSRRFRVWIIAKLVLNISEVKHRRILVPGQVVCEKKTFRIKISVKILLIDNYYSYRYPKSTIILIRYKI